jgi:hypothetical protein
MRSRKSSISCAASGTEAWVYSTTTGELRANVAGASPSGIDYFEL